MTRLRPNLHLIIVDDEPSERTILRRAFESVADDLVIDLCADVTSALQAAHSARRDHRSDEVLVISDLKMPGEGGLELARNIRSDESLAELPVILLSTSPVSRERAGAFTAGANAFHTKPLGYREMKMLASSILDYWSISPIQ